MINTSHKKRGGNKLGKSQGKRPSAKQSLLKKSDEKNEKPSGMTRVVGTYGRNVSYEGNLPEGKVLSTKKEERR